MASIMIIDDDPSILKALSVRLEAAGFDVVPLKHPKDAMPRVLRDQPDLIVLDIEMPNFNGLDFQECLYGTERGREIPIVYLSGAGTFPNRQDAFGLGARGFISKPYDADELLATIEGILKSTGVLESTVIR